MAHIGARPREGRVTGLEPDPRRPGSIRVLIDRTIFGAVDEQDEILPELRRRGSEPLDPDLMQRLKRAADREAAYRSVLYALETRAYARADLLRRLVRRGHDRDAVEAALARVEQAGLLDDAKFAEHYVETRAERGRGPARLRRDLLALGVDRAIVDRVIAARWPDGAGEPDVPLALAQKRAEQLGDLPRQTKRRRLLAYLARRGFTGRVATDAVARVL